MSYTIDRAIVALTADAEAANQSPEARRGVCYAVRNRHLLDPERYGKTLAAVCLKRFQFSEFNDDRPDNANLLRAASRPGDDPVLSDCFAAVDEMIGGDPDPTNGATHFYADTIPAPLWVKGDSEHGIPPATFTVKLDHLLFFKNVA